MNKMILIKYGELTTKKGNRSVFTKLLANNVKAILKGLDYKVTFDRVRMYVESTDIDEAIDRLKNVFGIHSIVKCYKVNTDVEEIKSSLIEILKNSNFKTFKVETNRADKNFEIHSMDFSRMMGGHILKNINCSVDVHNPDLWIKVEIREELRALGVTEFPSNKKADLIALLEETKANLESTESDEEEEEEVSEDETESEESEEEVETEEDEDSDLLNKIANEE